MVNGEAAGGERDGGLRLGVVKGRCNIEREGIYVGRQRTGNAGRRGNGVMFRDGSHTHSRVNTSTAQQWLESIMSE